MSQQEIEKEGRLGLKNKQLNPNQVKQADAPAYDGQAIFSNDDYIQMDEAQLNRAIPMSSMRQEEQYMKFTIQPRLARPISEADRLQVNQHLDEWARLAFEGVKTLNTIQSKVFQDAYSTDENILICAPTGAGKTNIALLTVLREISKHLIPKEHKISDASPFKIVYISPMKALAAEIVEKFQTRLKYLDVKVKELTGDMQLTKSQFEQTHVIVTTPEKWDVITRKSNTISETLKLVIIDEIHLLNDERGPVLECLVARTLLAIQRLQSSIRFLGLSATLPNYLDVAQFLKVRQEQVYFFDSSFRPVPLKQNFIGVKEPKQTNRHQDKRRKPDVYNDIAYDMAIQTIKAHKQVLIFVHSRQDTTITAQLFVEKAKESGHAVLLQNISVGDQKSLNHVADKLLGQLIPDGVGFHHAGMLRHDRNIVEKFFMNGTIKILVATATLAWGVNLPAYKVIIKGTDIFDPARGGMQDLNILDVQQMFGRAGRPQYDTTGQATLITDIQKVGSYMSLMTSTMYIESQLMSLIKESMNAEIALGNITKVQEAYNWLDSTFFAIRLRRNPMAYRVVLKKGYDHEVQIQVYISEMLDRTLNELDTQHLIRYDRKNNFLTSTELGRITSHFYVACQTMQIFCRNFGFTIGDDMEQMKEKKRQYKSDLALLKITASAKEFQQIKIRPEEMEEIKKLMQTCWILEGKPQVEQKKKYAQDHKLQEIQAYDKEEKVLILMQSYLRRVKFDNFSLISDSQYIVQNTMRILRCILDLCLKKNIASHVKILLNWCKYFENRVCWYESPLRQFCKENYQGYNNFKNSKNIKEYLSSDLVSRIENADISLEDLRTLEVKEIAQMLDTRPEIGRLVQSFALNIPYFKVEKNIKPIAQTVLKIDLQLYPQWNYSSTWHSKSEVFWVIVDDLTDILHEETFLVTQDQIIKRQAIEVSFFLPYRSSDIQQYSLMITSDVWIMQPEFDETIDLRDIQIQNERMDHTELLDLNPLPLAALNNPEFEKIYKFKYFNPNQTQVFHALYHTDKNVLIGSPTGSGKTIMAELAVLRIFQETPQQKVIYVAPLKAIAKQRLSDWKSRLGTILQQSVLELTGDFTPDLDALMKADVLITTPEQWDGISRSWNNRSYVQHAGLIIFDEIHLLGQDRGPVIEVIVSRMNLVSNKTTDKVRMVGLSTAMANGSDISEWFGVPKHYFFNFRPHVRPVPITIFFDGFPEKAYCPRMGTMNKPAYNAIKRHSDGKPVLIFVSSRRQTRLTALDIISYAIHDNSGSSPFVKCDHDYLEHQIDKVSDDYLRQTLSFGVGMHHAGLVTEDRIIVENLFLNNQIQVLVATSTLAWGVNFPARLVIIQGSQYFDPKSKRYVDMNVTDILQMIGRAGRPQFDDQGIACVFVEQSQKNFYRKYLNDPFPIESSLIQQIHDHFNAEIAGGSLTNQSQAMEWITWTYFFRRLLKNPSYYNLQSSERDSVKKYLIKLVDSAMERLERHGCIKMDDELKFTIEPTFLGNLASFYYIKHETAHYFNKNMKQNMKVSELVSLLSNSKEFEEVPLRHNQDNLNIALAEICPLAIQNKLMDTAQGKTFLLFQMHFFRIAPPIRDYLTDKKIVIDASIRIINALIDLSSNKGYYGTSMKLILLMQMVMQGLWHNNSAIINIPHFTLANTLKAITNGVSHFCQLLKFQTNQKELKDFLSFIDKQLVSDPDKYKDIKDAIDSLPIVSFRSTIKAFDSEELKEKEGELEDGGQAMVTAHLQKENTDQKQKVIMQKTSKTKDAAWWVMVADESNDKLLALKKVMFTNTAQKSFQVQLPSDLQQAGKLTVHLLSDSYLGMDQICYIKLDKVQQ